MRRLWSQMMVAGLIMAAAALAACSTASDSTRTAGDASGSANGSALAQEAAVSGFGGDTDGGAGAGGTASAGMDRDSGGAAGTGEYDASGRISPKAYDLVVELRDIHFDFDRYEIRPDAAKVLEESARWLKANPGHLVLIEGHADERGTNEYNMALGERRARAAMNYLISFGVQGDRISRISYGEEQPACRAHSEECWQENRRAHFAVKSR